MEEEVEAVICVAEAEVAGVEAAAGAVEEEDHRPWHYVPWQPGEEWHARKFPHSARNSVRNNQIPVSLFSRVKTPFNYSAMNICLK